MTKKVNLTPHEHYLVFEKPLKDFTDKDWKELYKVLDYDKEEQIISADKRQKRKIHN